MSSSDRSRFLSSVSWTHAEHQAAAGVPEGQNPHRGDGSLNAYIIYNRHHATLRAVSWVSLLGSSLGVRPIVLMFHSLPVSLPLDWKHVPEGFLEERIRTLKAESPVDFSVRNYLCRSTQQTLRQILRPGSLVAVGGERCWWPTDEQRLVSRLRKDGCQAFLVESRSGKAFPHLNPHELIQDLWQSIR